MLAPERAAAPAPEPSREGKGAATHGEATPQDLVARSVALGYRVIDDYIKQGQQTAQRLRQGAYGADSLATDVEHLATRLIETVSDFAATWVEFLELSRANGAASGNGEASPRSPAAARASDPVAGSGADTPAPGEVMRLHVRLSTRRQAEVVLDTEPIPAGSTLVPQALRAAEAGLPRIVDVAFEQAAAPGSATIAVRIPDHHPPGVYSGRIVDAASNRPVGTLTVTIPAVE
jgi:hypothetical protein